MTRPPRSPKASRRERPGDGLLDRDAGDAIASALHVRILAGGRGLLAIDRPVRSDRWTTC